MLQHGWHFLLKGGWVMWPLFVCAITSVTVMLERWVTIRRLAVNTDELMAVLRTHLEHGRRDAALQACRLAPGPVAAMLARGLELWSTGDAKLLESGMEEVALREMPHLQRRLGILDTIITLSPLLGLLGTITGMISSFNVVAVASGAEAGAEITGGIAEALIATATGLCIAIMTLPVYNMMNERVRDIISDMEVRATELVGIFERQAHATRADEEAARAFTKV